MSRSAFLLFLGASLSAGALLAGCSSSSGNMSTGGSSTTTTTHSGTTTAATLDCTSYCDSIMANCTGTNAQYTAMENCMGTCAGFTAQGSLSDTSGDTLGCRIYHAGAAASAPTVHCPHAGPTGGDESPTGTAGICGEPCTSFCSIQAAVCTGANQQFTSNAACMTACQGFKADTAAYSTADTANNDMGCRFYHLTAAAAGGAAATTHCPHIVAASPVCTM